MKKIIFLLTYISVLSVSGDTLWTQQANRNFSAGLIGTFRVPANSSSADWKRYQTGGITLEFPASIDNFYLKAGIEGGLLHDQNQLYTINCLHLYLGLVYEDQLLRSKVWLYPQIGLTSMMVTGENLVKALTERHTFSIVENEYGIFIGCEPRLKFRSFFVGLPVRIEKIFSSPKSFNSFVIAINTGYTFKK